jgi:hypothetical protein
MKQCSCFGLAVLGMVLLTASPAHAGSKSSKETVEFACYPTGPASPEVVKVAIVAKGKHRKLTARVFLTNKKGKLKTVEYRVGEVFDPALPPTAEDPYPTLLGWVGKNFFIDSPGAFEDIPESRIWVYDLAFKSKGKSYTAALNCWEGEYFDGQCGKTLCLDTLCEDLGCPSAEEDVVPVCPNVCAVSVQ